MTLAVAPLSTARVVDAWDETPMLRGLRLALPAEAARAHQRPGQVVKLHAAAGDAYFAVASAPSPGGIIELLVKRGGRVSDGAISAGDRRGDACASRPPSARASRWRRPTVTTCCSSRRARASRPSAPSSSTSWRHREHFDRPDAVLRAAPRRRFRLPARAPRAGSAAVCGSCCARRRRTRPGPGCAAACRRWRARSPSEESPPESRVAFVCGMTAMVDDVRATLARAGIAPDRVHFNF